MNLQILQKSAVATPIAGEVTLFMDADNNNALTAKFNDCTYKVLSAEPFQVKESQSLIDAQNDMLDKIGCALKSGTITAAEYQAIIADFGLYYTSTLSPAGDLSQSITTDPNAGGAPTVETPKFSVALAAPPTNFGQFELIVTSGIANNQDASLLVDRNGFAGDMSISFTSPDPAITLGMSSYVSDNVGAVTTYNGIVKEGTSVAAGEFLYDGTAITPGVYTGVVEVTGTNAAGSLTRYISVEITVS